jgi:hypothetical protein
VSKAESSWRANFICSFDPGNKFLWGLSATLGAHRISGIRAEGTEDERAKQILQLGD